jgi:hypothetical protein
VLEVGTEISIEGGCRREIATAEVDVATTLGQRRAQIVTPAPGLDIGESGTLADVKVLPALPRRWQGFVVRETFHRFLKVQLVFAEVDDVTTI